MSTPAEPGTVAAAPGAAQVTGPPIDAPPPDVPNPRIGAPPRRLFGERWPGPAAPPSRTVLLAVAGAGIAAAAAIPDGRPGLGWPVTAAAFATATLLVRWHTRRSAPPLPARLAAAGWTLAALALAGVGAVRDAEWLFALCLLAACAAGSLAVAGRAFRGVLTAALAVPVAALRGIPWVSRAVLDARRGANRRMLRLAVSGLVGVVLILVFGALLSSADAAFARVVDDLVPTFDGSSPARWVFLFGFGAVAVSGACFLLVAPPAPAAPVSVPVSRLRGVEWALPVGLLVGLFGLFVGVQFATLFGSDAYVLRSTGLTYAQYARSGFWQLLAVSVLTMGVIALGARWAPTRTPHQRGWTRGLLAALALLALVIVASALSRMWLYQQAYGFTVLRLLVLVCELWLGVGFLLALVAALRLRPAGLARGLAVAGTVALVSLAVLDPERFVAERNVARYGGTGEIDTSYLARLSADAVPALDRLPEPARSCALSRIARDLAVPDTDWRSANAARSNARALLAGPAPACRS